VARLTRRGMLGGVAGALACSGPSDRTSNPDDGTDSDVSPWTLPPGPHNIVYIYVDQHRGLMTGFDGHPVVLTPTLDALALESVRYPNMFTNSPLCQPARAVMMTGKLPRLNGCWNNQQNADPAVSGSHVQRIHDEAGYYTAMFGKAHLTTTIGHPGNPGNVANLAAWGFDETIELLSQKMCVTIPNFYSDWLVEITPTGQTSKASLYGDYVAMWDYIENNLPPDIAPWFITTDENVDVWCAQIAADWLRAYDTDQPFYLQVNLPGPHSPFDSTTEFRALYDVTDPRLGTAILEVPANPSPLVAFLLDHKEDGGFGTLTLDQSKALLLSYYAKITMIDYAVTRVIDALQETGLLDNTWLIYGADHGELVGDHMLWGKVAMYEGSVRTPLLVRPPGGVTGWTSEGLVDQVDLTATILEMAGLDNQASGSSRFAQIVQGPTDPGAQIGKPTIIAEIDGNTLSPPPVLGAAMVRRDRYKLVMDLDAGVTSELYDLEADPDEVNNLVSDPGQQTLIADMEEEYRASVDADLGTTG